MGMPFQISNLESRSKLSAKKVGFNFLRVHVYDATRRYVKIAEKRWDSSGDHTRSAKDSARTRFTSEAIRISLKHLIKDT